MMTVMYIRVACRYADRAKRRRGGAGFGRQSRRAAAPGVVAGDASVSPGIPVQGRTP